MGEYNVQIERCRREVYRIGWRLQYRVKKVNRHEFPLLDNGAIQSNESNQVDDRIYIQTLLEVLPEKGRLILQKIYLQDLTEAEVALQMHMSQQGVNKWRRRMLQQLSQTMSS